MNLENDALANAHEKPSGFVHLHVHSEYSLLDGTIRIKELVAKAKAMGHSHVALTDHGNMHGVVEFYLEAKKAGIVPIIGCELYHQGGEATLAYAKEKDHAYPKVGAFHLIVLAKNTTGYKELLKLVSSGFIGDNFKEVPIVAESALDEHHEQVIALSSCTKGELAYLVAELRSVQRGQGLNFKDEGEASTQIIAAIRQHIDRVHARYGRGNYYVELQDNGLPHQKGLIRDLAALAKFFDLPLVASADAHYLEADFAETHALATAIKNGITLNDIRGRLRGTKFHLMSDQEMRSWCHEWPAALENTVKIAEQCSHVEIKMDTYYLPKIDLGTGEDPTAALKRIAKEGLLERFTVLDPLYGPGFDEEAKKEYWTRLDYELDVIIQMGFPDYFLIVQDFINWAKKQDIPVGPGRGSGAGSLVAYALKITDLDPIPYHLIFERFLNPERVSMPDFDVDFCQWRREEVIQYCVEKYGITNVAQITTFGKMQAKGAVKSVGRAMNLGYTRVDQFTKLFPPDLGITLKDAVAQEPRLTEAMNQDESLKECMDSAFKLEGLSSHTSVHPAGLVISDGHMTNYLPVYTTDGKSFITQFEMKPTEKVGLVKFDFLGLKTLTVIAKAVELVRKRANSALDIAKIPMDDQKVFEMISQGHTCGIFQCESLGMTQLITKLKPSNFEDIIALVALFRPGPLGSGMVDDFVERKHGRQKISYPHPYLEDILKDTYGMILYQEQVQKIAAVLANYSLGEADLLRRAMGKKIPEEMAKQKDRFLQGAKENNIDLKLAEEIFDLMAEFAKYGFNKSHSAAYGLVSYQTAYLKTHYPEEFLAASMTCDMDNTDKIVRYSEDCLRLGFEILPPALNRSLLEFDVPKVGQVGFALTAIKGVGSAVLEPLVEERQKGLFLSLSDLSKRVHLGKVGKKTLQLLAAAGVFDEFGYSRKALDQLIPDVVNYSIKHFEAQAMGQRSLFDLSVGGEEDLQQGQGISWQEDQLPYLPASRSWQVDDLFEEKKLLGRFLTNHPINFFDEDIKKFSTHSLSELHALLAKFNPDKRNKEKVAVIGLLTNIHQRRTKKGSLMASLRIEDAHCSFEAVLFEEALKDLDLSSQDVPVVINGTIEPHYDGTSMRYNVERVQLLEEVRQQRVKGVVLRLKEKDFDEMGVVRSEVLKLFETHKGLIRARFRLDLGEAELLIDINKYQVELSNSFVTGVGQLLKSKEFMTYVLH